MNPNKFKSDIKKFRILLIILTIIHLAFILLFIGGFDLIVNYGILDIAVIWLWIFSTVAGAVILWIFRTIFTFIVMRYEGKHMLITPKKNFDNILMILFTGIIGLWLWIPNKKEVDQIIKKAFPSSEVEKSPNLNPQ